MWSHEAEVAIDATPSEVWRVLADLDRYPQWNRYAITATGELREGGEVEINVPRQGGKRGPVNNRVTELVINERLCWRSLSWYRFLVYGVRCRHLDVQPDGTTVFREVETMHGPLAGVIDGQWRRSCSEGCRPNVTRSGTRWTDAFKRSPEVKAAT